MNLAYLIYNVYRSGRSCLTSSFIFGCSVLIGVRKNIPSFHISVSEKSVKQLFVRFSIEKTNFIISFVYIPPQSPFTIYETHVLSIKHVLNLYPIHTYIFCGDYYLKLYEIMTILV